MCVVLMWHVCVINPLDSCCKVVIIGYRSTIAGSFKKNSKNKKCKNYEIMQTKKEKKKKKFLQSIGVSKPFKVIFTDFFC